MIQLFNSFFRDRSLFIKFLMLSIIPIVIVLIFISMTILNSQKQLLSEKETTRISLLADHMALTLSDDHVFYNKHLLDRIIDNLQRDASITDAFLVDTSDNTILSHNNHSFDGKTIKDMIKADPVNGETNLAVNQISRDVIVSGQKYGVLNVGYNLAEVNNELKRMQRNFIAIILTALVVGTLFSFIIARWIRDPILALVKQIQAIKTDHFEDRVVYESKDIIGQLAREFNKMVTLLNQKQKEVIDSELRLRTLIHSIPDLVWMKDPDGVYVVCNSRFENFFGAKEKDIVGKTDYDFVDQELADFFRSQDDEAVKKGASRTNEEEIEYASDGHHEILETIKTPVFANDGKVIGVLGIARNITERKIKEKVQAAKINIAEYSIKHPTKKLLKKFLDEVENLTESEIGFYHFVNEDQQTISLQTWSTNTLDTICDVEVEENHYPFNESGVWIDCVKDRKPVIHNDYESLPHKKGLLAAHAPVIRELVVPVVRGGKIVAILGVGNKKTNYSEHDINTVQMFADLCWEMIIYKRSEDARQETERKYSSVMETINDPVYISSSDFLIEYANPAMEQMIGNDYLEKDCFKKIYGLNRQCDWCPMDIISKGQASETEVINPDNNRTYFISHSPLMYQDKSYSKIAVCKDVTEFKNAQGQLRHTQKMESIGHLAGGIAHDFNNILFPIVGMSEMLLEDLPIDSPERQSAQEIYKAGQRGSDLVKRILAFSRQADHQVIPIKIQSVLKEVIKLCRSSIPMDIKISENIDYNCKLVNADQTQIHQVAMNLITNAYHAVETNSGEISVSLKEVDLDQHNLSNSDIEPGQYIKLSVSDTGYGIDHGVIDKIFDPYFTTKKQGKGTGLGLATVYGIIKEHQGAIQVSSKPNKGSTFDVFLPLITATPEVSKKEKKELHETGDEKVLLVDDEKPIANLEKLVLERLGYKVTVRTNGLDALEVFKASPDDFDIIITDMSMPNMTGIQLAREIVSIRPDLPIIICTGFSERIDKKSLEKIGVKELLMKPVVKSEIAATVRKVLDEKISPHSI